MVKGHDLGVVIHLPDVVANVPRDTLDDPIRLVVWAHGKGFEKGNSFGVWSDFLRDLPIAVAEDNQKRGLYLENVIWVDEHGSPSTISLLSTSLVRRKRLARIAHHVDRKLTSFTNKPGITKLTEGAVKLTVCAIRFFKPSAFAA